MSERTVYTIQVTIDFTPNDIGGDPAPMLDAVNEAIGDLFENGLPDLGVTADARILTYRQGLTSGDGR